MKIIEKRLDQIVPYENNPRHNDDAVEYVANSIREFGWKQPIVIDRDGVIVAGHTRYKAAMRLGITTAPCVVADDLTEEQVKAYRLADNKVAERATWDFEALEAELDGIELDMSEFGFEIEPEEQETSDDDYEVEVPEEPQAQRGNIYQLGNHRLMCGDATSAADMQKLMAGAQADLLLTDPPYNVALGQNHGHTLRPSEARALHRRTDGKVIENDAWEDDEDFIEFLVKAFQAAESTMKPGAAFYIWYASNQSLNFLIAAQRTGLQVRQHLIWVKSIFTFGRQDYQWQHEPCLYGWKDGAAHYFIQDRTQATVFDDQPDLNKMKKEEMRELLEKIFDTGELTTVLREKKPTASVLHPTMKPVPLIGRLIHNSSRQEENVLDPFGGSGSTLIACEQLNRRCYMMELDPRYVDVIVDRWEKFTGRTAELLRA